MQVLWQRGGRHTEECAADTAVAYGVLDSAGGPPGVELVSDLAEARTNAHVSVMLFI